MGWESGSETESERERDREREREREVCKGETHPLTRSLLC
jgi:hypothetical protein